ncbi:MAG: 16S rRNA (guanine(527)-N(7))-methyltransferase RsmG [Deltaproteobacteria bacterium]|nr:16S rRNA (guanine(527)-N(7))-methyltransferase RsmG [Deltaproteobacteria bacterium]
MTAKEPWNLLLEGAAILGISLTHDQMKAFELYLKELNLWRKKINLASRKDDREVILKDFLDSLTLLKYLPQEKSVLDLGSGAGFPGIPLRIVRPDLKIVLLEATRKKVFFLKEVLRISKLSGVEVRWSGEDGGIEGLSATFDFVISRAFGSLLAFASEGVDFLKKGGILLAMKGKKGREELEESLASLKDMSLEPNFLEAIQLPYLGHERNLIGLKKK